MEKSKPNKKSQPGPRVYKPGKSFWVGSPVQTPESARKAGQKAARRILRKRPLGPKGSLFEGRPMPTLREIDNAAQNAASRWK